MSGSVFLLIPLALGFAALIGLNDGSVLVVTGPVGRASEHLFRILVLAAAVVLVPLAGVSAVGTTLAARLGPSGEAEASAAVVCGVVAAAAIALVLHRLRRPTSLTLALVGALAGASVAFTGRMAWAALLLALGLGLLAPAAAAFAGWAVGHVPRLFDQRIPAARATGPLGPLSFAALSIAYGLNDGQKAIVVPIVAVASSSSSGANAQPGWKWLIAVGAAFAVGAWAGRRPASRSLVAGVVPVRARFASAARFSTAAVSIGGAAAGAPLSMTQSLAASLAGTGAGEGWGRVRWGAARSIALAWAVTPLCGFAAAAILAGGWRAVL